MCLRLVKNTEGTIYCTQVLDGWAVGVAKSVEKKKNIAGQFAVKCKSDTYCRTNKLNREDYGVHNYWVLLAVVKE